MVENTQFPEQEPMQQPEPKLKKIWQVVTRDGLYTKDFDSFQKKYSDSENVKKLHSILVRDGYYTKSEEDFIDQYVPELKKKDEPIPSPVGGENLQPVSPSKSTLPFATGIVKEEKAELLPKPTEVSVGGEPIPTTEFDNLSVIDKALKSKELKDKRYSQEIAFGGGTLAGGGVGYEPELSFQEQNKKGLALTKQLEQLGVNADKAAMALDGLKFATEESKQRLENEFSTNPNRAIRIASKVNRTQRLTELVKQATDDLMVEGDTEAADMLQQSFNIALQAQGAKGYNEQRNAISATKGLIQAIGGEESNKLFDLLREEVKMNYGGALVKGDQVQKQTYKDLDEYESVALDFLQDTDPDGYESFKVVLTDPGKDANSNTYLIGIQEKRKRLREIGINLAIDAAEEMAKTAQVGGDFAGAEFYANKSKELQTRAANLYNEFPLAGQMDAMLAAKEISGLGGVVGAAEQIGATASVATMKTAVGAFDLVADNFPFFGRSKEQRDINNIETLGLGKVFNLATYLPQENLNEKSFKLVVKPELQAKLDPIIKSNLSNNEKQFVIGSLLQANRGSWSRIPVEPQSNVSVQNTLLSVANLGANLLPYIGITAITGGGAAASLGRAFTSEFVSAALTMYEDMKIYAVENNKPNPEKYALIATAINGIANGIAGTGQTIRQAAGKLKDPTLREAILRLDDNQILAMLRDGEKVAPTALGRAKQAFDRARYGVVNMDKRKAVKDALKGLGETTKETAKLTGILQAGQVGANLATGEEVTPERVAKDFLLQSLDFGIFTTLLRGGRLANMRQMKRDEVKFALFEAANDPTNAKLLVDELQKSGKVTIESANQIKANIDLATKVLKNTPLLNAKGKQLTDVESRELVFLKMIEADLEGNLSKSLPKQLQERMMERLAEVQDKIDEVYQGTFIDNVLLRESKKQEEQAKEDTKLSEPIEGLDEQGVPIPIPEAPVVEGKPEEISQPIELALPVVEQTTADVGGVKSPDVSPIVEEVGGVGVGGDNIEQVREKLKDKYGVYLGGEFENHHSITWSNKNQRWEIVSQSAKYNEDKGYREFEQKTIAKSDAKNREDALKELEAYAKEKGITLYDESDSLSTEATAFTKENREKFDAELKSAEQSLKETPQSKEAKAEQGSEVVGESVSDADYANYVDNNIASPELLNSIADKVISRQPLSERETAIFSGKTSEINDIIRAKSGADATKASGKSVPTTEPKSPTTAKEGTQQEVPTSPKPISEGTAETTTAVLGEGGDGAGTPPPPTESRPAVEPGAVQFEGTIEQKRRSVAQAYLTSKGMMEYAPLREHVEKTGNFNYRVQNQKEAESAAKDIIGKFGDEEAFELARTDQFDYTINASVMAQVLDNTYAKEKQLRESGDVVAADRLATQYADYLLEFSRKGTQFGQFISQIGYQYRKSPMGVIAAIKKGRDEQARIFLEDNGANLDKVFDEMMKNPEFSAKFTKEAAAKAEEIAKAERVERRKNRDKKFDDAIDKIINTLRSGNYADPLAITPTTIAALKAAKAAYKAGAKLVDLVEDIIIKIKNENGGAIKDEDKLRSFVESTLKDVDGSTSTKPEKGTPEYEEATAKKYLEEMAKKVGTMTKDQKDRFVKKALQKMAKYGYLGRDEFKDLITESIGLKITPEVEAEMKTLVEKMNKAEEASNALIGKGKDATEADIAEYDKQINESAQAALDMSRITGEGATMGEVLRASAVAGLFHPEVWLANVPYNLAAQSAKRFPVRIIRTFIEFLGQSQGILSKAESTKLASSKYFKTLFKEYGKFWDNIVNTNASLESFEDKAYKGLIDSPGARKQLKAFKEGRLYLTKSQQITRYARGYFPGAQAEAIMRIMGSFDIPHRRAAEAAEAARIAFEELGIFDDTQYQIFVRNPEKYAFKVFSESGEYTQKEASQKAAYIRERIVNMGKEAVYQQDNLLKGLMQGAERAIKVKDDDPTGVKGLKVAGGILKTSTVPVLTAPSNIAWEQIKMTNPVIPFLQAIWHRTNAATYKKQGKVYEYQKERNAALQSTAFLVYAVAVQQGVSWLASQGVIQPQNIKTGEAEEKREFSGENYYGNAGTTDIGELMNFGFSFKIPNKISPILIAAETQVRMAQMKAKDQREKLNYEEADWVTRQMQETALSTSLAFRSLLYNQTARVMSSLVSKEPWKDFTGEVAGMGVTALTGSIPAWLSAKTDEYKYDTRDDNALAEIGKIAKAKLSILRFIPEIVGGNKEEWLPYKLDLWGNPLKVDNSLEAVVLSFFGNPTGKKADDFKPLFPEVSLLALQTNDESAYPLWPSRNIKVDGKSYKLSVKEHRDLVEFTQLSRQKLTEHLIKNGSYYNNKKWDDMNDDEKIKALNKIYSMGSFIGMERFRQKYSQLQNSLSEEEIDAFKKMEDNDWKEMQNKIFNEMGGEGELKKE